MTISWERNMKKSTILAAAALAMTAFGAHAQNYPGTSFSRAADPNGNLIGLSTPNGRIAWDYIDLWFNKHQAAAAWDKYVARQGFYNHAVYNSTTATVDKTFDQEKAEEARAAGPGTVFKLEQIVAEGNLVFLHIAASRNDGVGAATGLPAPGAGTPPAGPGPGGPGPVGDGKGDDEMVMILRIEHGKVVDHWDLHVPTNSNSVVFAGLDRQIP